MDAMQAFTRTVFWIVSLILTLLAAGLVGFSAFRVYESIGARGDGIEAGLLSAVGYIVIAVAIFDVAKYLFEEEVLRGRELRHASEARRSMTKFISTISIAVFIEGLVVVFQTSKKDVSDMIYPILLLLTGVVMIVGLGAYQRLSLAVEKSVDDTDGNAEPKT